MQTEVKNAIFSQTETNIENFLRKLEAYRSRLQDNPLPLFNLPAQTDDFSAIEEMAKKLMAFKRVIFLGTGGASLGAQVLVQLKGWGTPAGHQKAPGQPDLYFLDNLSPRSLHDLIPPAVLPETGFVVISKSGSTTETLMQFSAALSAVEHMGLEPAKHFFVITEQTQNVLHRIAESLNIAWLPHNQNIGGRFSALTNVGLLPAALAGLDIKALRQGAGKALSNFMTASDLSQNSPSIGAALQIAHAKQGRVISVLMPYEEKLDRFSFWYRQLWAESLGKDGQGTTPVNALGPVDEHSQSQLYLDGPDDKFYTLITTPQDVTLVANAASCDVPELNWLQNRSIGAFVSAQAQATYQALVNHNRPVRKIDMPDLNEASLGQLMMDFMLETILAAHLLNVNAFDQPAVEEGKIIAKQFMDG